MEKRHRRVYNVSIQRCLELNSPIIQVFPGPFEAPWIVLCDAQESLDVFSRRGQDSDRSGFMMSMFGALFPNGQMCSKTNEHWRHQRSLAADTMSPKFLRTVARAHLHPIALSMVNGWRQSVRLSQGRPFEASQDIRESLLDSICSVTLGSSLGVTQSREKYLLSEHDPAPKRRGDDIDLAAPIPRCQTPPDFHAILDLMETLEIFLQVPVGASLIHKCAVNPVPSLREASRRVKALIDTSMKRGLELLSAGIDSNILSATDLLVSKQVQLAHKQSGSQRYSYKDIHDELVEFVAGGFATTASTICWGLKLLTANPQKQRILREQLCAAFPRSQLSCSHPDFEMPSADAILDTHLPYLDAVVEETLRCGGSISAQMRQTTRDTQLLGHLIPKNTEIFLPLIGPGYMASPFTIDNGKRSPSSQES